MLCQRLQLAADKVSMHTILLGVGGTIHSHTFWSLSSPLV